ncbi:peptidoglycan bridge formation glycyltransferase FemA/FemB family protein [Candidatus Falkowbacteria bacterium]|jgi:peptidoglycan pentaglycine glycine transferase (the first glycine)|nr:peptidoglycan bridge formation glycyltransferase FemA/FemB family protein [Candidatus Falkowbacteria bacterium]MBT4433577.1 peptidoglycan bridge formation glycyltransferase FemA/FemB family protein [Candidatus Falkowbacteria bacterium]
MNIVYFQKDKVNGEAREGDLGQEQEKWNNFLSENSEDGGFLQSWAWGDFQQDLGKKIWRIGIEDNNGKLLTVCLAIRDDMALRRVTIDIPRLGILNIEYGISNILEVLVKELKKIAVDENAMVVRVDFGVKVNSQFTIHNSQFNKLGLRRAHRDIQPRSTLVVDLSKSEEEILKEMKQKHRYNIRLAEKRGVKIELIENNKEEGLENFWELLKLTSKRDRFAIHEKNYYLKLLNTPGLDTRLYLAKYLDEVIAGAIIGQFGNTCVYLHGVSGDRYRNVMAPYLLQWQIMLDIKQNGYKFYDFGGIKSEKSKSSSQTKWQGITRFKIGFAPNQKTTEFLGLWEIRVKPCQYFVYRIIRGLAKLKK